ncbi:MAG TPA: hypothetical protein VFT69_18230 [Pseudolabrys sp.]|jgi:hypothetical protein|nr:hypothetical protein [Pseudolabrys sp.]
MKGIFAACAAAGMALAAASCATSPAPARVPVQPGWIAPAEAIQRAAEAAPSGVPGIFAMHVQATGTQDGYAYLNSELDYRDQRNLTVAISPNAAKAMEAKLGVSPLDYYKGKDILVHGSAYRTKISITMGHRYTGKYYYQTHVRVADPAQVEVRR